jgi:hypothetical protein
MEPTGRQIHVVGVLLVWFFIIALLWAPCEDVFSKMIKDMAEAAAEAKFMKQHIEHTSNNMRGHSHSD